MDHFWALTLSSWLSTSVGPLHSDRQYDISARKEGFVLSPLDGKQGDFKAFALAGVTFKVVCFVSNLFAVEVCHHPLQQRLFFKSCLLLNLLTKRLCPLLPSVPVNP